MATRAARTAVNSPEGGNAPSDAAMPAGEVLRVVERLPTRPYLLESATVKARYDADRIHAEAEIEQIESDILVIRRTANSDIEQIAARADTEVSAREQRRADLLLIVGAASAAIEAMKPAEAQEAKDGY